MKKIRNLFSVMLAIISLIFTGIFLTACNNVEPELPESVLATKIQISDSALSMKIGDTETLTATVNFGATNRDVEWLTSNANIATVNNGVVTAIGAGEATITAKTVDGSDLTATCQVTVSAIASELLVVDQTNKPATPDETISAGQLTLFADGTYKVDAFYAGLGAQMLFEGEYTISGGELSFSEDVPVVVFGVEGTAHVTATVAGKTVVVNVETIDAEANAAVFTIDEAGATVLGLTLGESVAVTGITCSATDAIEVEVGRTIDIASYFTVAPANATNKDFTLVVTEGEDSAGVNGTVVYGDAVGEATLTAKTADGSFTTTIDINVIALVPRVRPTAFDNTKVVEEEITFEGSLMGLMPLGFKFMNDGTCLYTVDQTALGGTKQETSGFYTYEASGDQATVKVLMYTNMEKDSTYEDTAIETLAWEKSDGKWKFNYQGLAEMTEGGAVAPTPVAKPRPDELGETYFASETVFSGLILGMLPATLTLNDDGTMSIESVVNMNCYYSFDETTKTLKYIAVEFISDSGEITKLDELKTATVTETSGVMSFTVDDTTYTQQIEG